VNCWKGGRRLPALIRAAAADGNDATASDSDWQPEIVTLPFPDYPSANTRACHGDVTPCFSSTGSWNPDHGRGTGDEAKQVHGRADHRDPEGA
jgi:hypothetical protein